MEKPYVRAENRAENRAVNTAENKDPIHIRFTPIQGFVFSEPIGSNEDPTSHRFRGTRTPPLRFRGGAANPENDLICPADMRAGAVKSPRGVEP